ncbi:hypothetical protein QFZ79_000399 [Arthrobacter sp. V4I6]|uniref:hypothetical protein n=1 Tax=unclassified Arthrobacter TaxID=235627 RepID=UPI002784FC73|nr:MULTISPECIES: hypothetical protein [unclassified Arthrobacter]MDQ0822660.1 hypothetical protein [Arthrobacter sp. V1I7]MDQ0852288.1 hypothetical protein [Arthrobacter sp. V4I6]
MPGFSPARGDLAGPAPDTGGSTLEFEPDGDGTRESDQAQVAGRKPGTSDLLDALTACVKGS